ncbi:hypothetical protein [Alcanivorax quisquiliarum]|uniref:Glycosyl transferase family 2 n=1 Tax=Alcanivorax quisquiliarum TaxID=2933565 RepID=A0ABT0E3I9_9GAMM|nr:hypothetical protein [Alcanivorax quisquiliarum]MCK0536383.1 hypothetical protein [Alcanivorax quisquiliarum]
MYYKAPVLLFTYRKPQFLEEIFQAIKQYSPPRLYIASNLHACEEERAVVESIRRTIRKWELPGEILLLCQDKHLLINESIHSGLDHVFSIEEAAIILEDDTVPSASFFSFCNTMLGHHWNSPEIGSIVGCNLGAIDDDQAAYQVPFAIFYWGWATWAKTWQALRDTPLPFGQHDNGVVDKLQDPNSILIPFLQRLDDRCTWDVRWGWQQTLHGLHTVLPGKNMVTNKGFVLEGSYIRFTDSALNSLPCNDMNTEALKRVMHAEHSACYEQRTAAMLTEILLSRSELDYYASLAN